MIFDPHRETIAYLIWCHSQPRGWADTVPEIAQALHLPMPTVRGVVRSKGWYHRLPKVAAGQPPRQNDTRLLMDSELDDLARRG